MHANSKALDATGVQPLTSDHNDVHTSHPFGVLSNIGLPGCAIPAAMPIFLSRQTGLR